MAALALDPRGKINARTVAVKGIRSPVRLILMPTCAKMCVSTTPQGKNHLEESMRNHFSKAAVGCALAVVYLANAASAQTPPPGAQAAPAETVGIVVANPTYISIPLEITINRPAAEVWKRVGKFCDIGEWLRIPCTITSGKDGEFGAVRSVAGEVLVAKTELSYTYTQTVRAGRPYNLYHGTLEARPVSASTSKLVYTLLFDNSMLADDAAREKDKAQKTRRLRGRSRT